MRVGFFVPSLGPTEGQGTVDLELLRRVARAGHQLDVYAGVVRDEVRALPGVRVHPLPRLPAWQLGNQMLSLARTSVVTHERYDVVHADAGVTLRRADVMVCHTLSKRWLELPSRIWREPGVRGANNAAATHLKARLEISQYRNAKLVLANSFMTANDLARYGVERDRIRVIPFGVDATRFRPPSASERVAARASFGVTENEFVTLLVGAHGERKGLPAALEALKTARPGERLLLAGEHRGGAWLRGARGLPVIAPGKLEDIVRAYHAADLLIAPSWYDAFGLSVLEAMACGLPVVVSRETGSRDCIEDAGIVLEDHSAKSLRYAVDALRSDPSRLERMSLRARELAHRRDWDTAGAVLLQAYESFAE